MMILKMMPGEYGEIAKHLVQADSDEERAAFLFARQIDNQTLQVDRVRVPDRSAYEGASWGYLELRDGLLGELIREAHILGTALIEAHSHPFDGSEATRFSAIDIDGLEKTAPHVVWRLPGRPFAAFVFGRKRFDSLYWSSRSSAPNGVVQIQIGSELLAPTGLSLGHVKGTHGSI